MKTKTNLEELFEDNMSNQTGHWSSCSIRVRGWAGKTARLPPRSKLPLALRPEERTAMFDVAILRWHNAPGALWYSTNES
jgi:hypothetical protein